MANEITTQEVLTSALVIAFVPVAAEEARRKNAWGGRFVESIEEVINLRNKTYLAVAATVATAVGALLIMPSAATVVGSLLIGGVITTYFAEKTFDKAYIVAGEGLALQKNNN